MIEFFKQRKMRKQLKEYFNAARHARHMREDIADPKDLEALGKAEQAVRDLHASGQGGLEKAVEALGEATDRVYPMSYRSGMRENVEVVIVALAAAMAIRAFFFQPFKIPTGSMQPTLNGITTEAQEGAGLMDRQPLKFAKWLVTGTSYKEYRAKVSGAVVPIRQADGRWANVARYGDKYVMNIGGTLHKFPVYMGERFSFKNHYNEGDIIVSANVIAGDHILVNKMKYNFMNPDRGDIAVFDTRHIDHPDVRKDTFYIKRMVGLPNEKIQIRDGRIVADGKVVSDPPVFEKIATDPDYDGHVLATYMPGRPAPKLYRESDVLALGADEYLMLGDNTTNSEDGRYFGAVLREDFQGPAMFVYWPFREHWGTVQ